MVKFEFGVRGHVEFYAKAAYQKNWRAGHSTSVVCMSVLVTRARMAYHQARSFNLDDISVMERRQNSPRTRRNRVEW